MILLQSDHEIAVDTHIQDCYTSFTNEKENKMKRTFNSNVGLIGGIFTSVFVLCSIIAAWMTHVIICIQTASWILLVIGIFVPPIGWVHGFGIWFGLF